MRIRFNKNAENAIKKRADIVITNPTQLKNKWRQSFFEKTHTDQPIRVELGMGKGQYVTEMALLNPEINFIGIDMRNELLYAAMRKVMEKQVEQNVFLILANIESITDMFGENEVNLFYINFCDPWPKARHSKRRLTHRSFLKKYIPLLVNGGEIIFKTDNEGLFDFSIPEFEAAGYEINEISRDLHKLNDPSNVMTEYEKKFSDKGQPIFRLRATIKKS